MLFQLINAYLILQYSFITLKMIKGEIQYKNYLQPAFHLQQGYNITSLFMAIVVH